MRLAETPRQILAGLAGAGGFLGTYAGLGLVWWLALGAGLGIWAATLLLVETRPPPALPPEPGDDLAAARARVAAAADRLRDAAGRATGEDARAFAAMAESLDALARHYADDPSDYRRTRRFVVGELPLLMETVERYLSLRDRARGENAERLAALGATLHAYVPVLERLDQACLENDFVEFEVQLGVLSDKLARRPEIAP